VLYGDLGDLVSGGPGSADWRGRSCARPTSYPGVYKKSLADKSGSSIITNTHCFRTDTNRRSKIINSIMRSSLFILALPALCFAAPPDSPRITRIVFSGSGCPNDSGSVKSDTVTLGDTAGVSFSELKGTDTDNCAVHIQSSGGTPGWQVAVSQITYEGDVNLRGHSELDTFTQIFWSDNAANTVS
jgi:hypothetical protein